MAGSPPISPTKPSREYPRATPARLLIIGLAAGVLSSLLGVGGGIIMIPALAIWLNVNLKHAVAASSAAIILIAGAGVALEEIHAPQNISWLHAILLAVTSITGVLFGQWVKPHLPERAIAISFSLVLLFSAAKLAGLVNLTPGGAALFPIWLENLGWQPESTNSFVLMLTVLAVLGFLGGIAASLLGLGGGIVYVPGLAILFFAGEINMSRATSLAAVVLTSAYAALMQARAKQIPKGIVWWLLPTGIAGALGGVLITGMVDAKVLQYLIAGAITLAALRMAWPGRQPESQPTIASQTGAGRE